MNNRIWGVKMMVHFTIINLSMTNKLLIFGGPYFSYMCVESKHQNDDIATKSNI
jgi:hypothetical protein